MARYALLSVSDKTGLEGFARVLVDAGFTLLSTGGTAKALIAAGLPVTKVSTHTGAPEIMNGRVKTLHPRIHGGILADRVAHAEEAALHDIPFIDVVVCNLYPFERVTTGGAELAEAIENIDIGGPTMVRASAKNFAHVAIVTDPADYPAVGEAIAAGGTDLALRQRLALKAFRHTSRYDGVISAWLGARTEEQGFPAEQALPLSRVEALRYGENPHQRAVFYADADGGERSMARMVQHQGLDMSFNNYNDLDGALRTVFDFDRPAVAVIKHANPCGCAEAETPTEAFGLALAGDPVSAYGGILAFNRPVGIDEVRAIKQSRTFFEILAAPGFSPEALEALKTRQKLRVLELPADWAPGKPGGMDAKRVLGGWLVQDWDGPTPSEWRVVTKKQPTDDEMRAMRFAWVCARNVKSNAIVLARPAGSGVALNGVGAGQMSRIDSVRLSISKATLEVAGSVLASDAFFPFADGLLVAAEAGVTAAVSPGGSIRDDEVIAAADEAGLALVFTGVRHFRH
ncbi:MAG: bifunctional phosphoribosylaminoimidazolecarboxamide formyltransferase/IMP cyclohydrolase [Myxococcota bacterium]